MQSMATHRYHGPFLVGDICGQSGKLLINCGSCHGNTLVTVRPNAEVRLGAFLIASPDKESIVV
jgi:hypothetical protein